ncbi:NAD(P)/FAD-dependent oxidoreductase [Flavobacterium azooxidireducens]|uniref:NAD(P)/FAD-dependent oxidoreductase n=1 Tax=Flavobacterium azooxidireducens TaxID=1871076 RepID=A0ABY4KI27_9FLAO|nr:NAD(P)/FAD-dependent oxidoreductase [Flavobacterium azooxidireducens]UPQ79931.1 NAD(P)/FAD-dependent oxidoreductase [Flavobacterium azooxidireducens]
MEEFDSIIIGSGAGGLTTALCLARAGQKVLVLEQHDVPGGWCHSFTLNGQRFSPGVHYIGLLGEGQSTNQLYKSLGIANDLIFFRMNKNGYDHCHIGDYRFDYPAGIENLKNKLASEFPHEAKNIKEYLSLIEKVNYELQLIPKLKGLWQKITVPFRTKHFGKFALFSLKRVIDWHIKDPMVKAILNAQCGDHGLPPNRASFPVHCSVMNHYFEGGYYPMGGGGGIVKAMTTKIKSFGGVIKTQQKVCKILLENKKAIGVELQDGKRFYAKNIISNADPSTTFLKFIGKENCSKKLLKRLDKTRYSVTSLILFLTVDIDVTLFGIDSGNIWKFKNEDIDGHFEILTKGNITDGDEFPALFMSCTTLKDPVSFNGRYHNFEIVTYVDFDSFKQFNQDDYHTPEYEVFKNKVIEKFLNTIETIIPPIRQHIVQAELGTPKTNQFYINSTRGNVYGTEKTLRQIGPFAYKNQTEFENLYLCGASTLSHGVTGASYSGLESAARILNCKSTDFLIEDESQKITIFDAEDSSTWNEYVLAKREDKIRTFKEVKI